MTSQNANIQIKTGIHSRPAIAVANAANRFKSNITISKGSWKCDAKSFLGILQMRLLYGEEITVTAVGVDEQEALETMIVLLISKFGEE
jgi:phosphocarrier protein